MLNNNYVKLLIEDSIFNCKYTSIWIKVGAEQIFASNLTNFLDRIETNQIKFNR